MRTIVLKIERRQADMFAEQGGIKYLGIVRNDFAEDAIALVRWHYRKAGCIEVVHDAGGDGCRVGQAIPSPAALRASASPRCAGRGEMATTVAVKRQV
ncbi:MAG TPA: hypothetical protein VF524_06110 [Polyangia bacterium]